MGYLLSDNTAKRITDLIRRDDRQAISLAGQRSIQRMELLLIGPLVGEYHTAYILKYDGAGLVIVGDPVKAFVTMSLPQDLMFGLQSCYDTDGVPIFLTIGNCCPGFHPWGSGSAIPDSGSGPAGRCDCKYSGDLCATLDLSSLGYDLTTDVNVTISGSAGAFSGSTIQFTNGDTGSTGEICFIVSASLSCSPIFGWRLSITVQVYQGGGLVSSDNYTANAALVECTPFSLVAVSTTPAWSASISQGACSSLGAYTPCGEMTGSGASYPACEACNLPSVLCVSMNDMPDVGNMTWNVFATGGSWTGYNIVYTGNSGCQPDPATISATFTSACELTVTVTCHDGHVLNSWHSFGNLISCDPFEYDATDSMGLHFATVRAGWCGT